MQINRRRKLFTLVELLIVIAIITILAAFLLPALQSAVYQSKKVACMNSLKQVYTGLVSYASDHRRTYPKRGNLRYDLREFRSTHADYDIAPIMSPYYGDSLPTSGSNIKDVFACPLAPVGRPSSRSSYMMFFQTKGLKEGWTIGASGGTRKHQRRVDGTLHTPGSCGTSNGSCSTACSWWYNTEEGVMAKMGQSWTLKSSGEKHDVILGDTVCDYGGHPQYRRWTNHHEFVDSYSSEVYECWSTEKGSKLYPATSATYVGGDGRAKSYMVMPSPIFDGFAKAGNYLFRSEDFKR